MHQPILPAPKAATFVEYSIKITVMVRAIEGRKDAIVRLALRSSCLKDRFYTEQLRSHASNDEKE